MFFIASKIFWMLAMPLNALCFLALLGFGVRFWRKAAGECLLGFSLICILLLGLFPVGPMMVGWLESHYKVPQNLPARVDGIIVLGGMFDTHLSDSRGDMAANDNIERMFCFNALANQYPSARKVFSGGSGDILHQGTKEADVALQYFDNVKSDADIIYEKDSRNTYENAVFTKELVNPVKGQNWIIVTSGYHMPRSVGIFAAQDWDVIPYPCDFKTDGKHGYLTDPPNATFNFRMLDIAVKELIGSLVYYMTGKSAFILPPHEVP